MSNDIYPTGILGLAYTVTKTPEFSTTIQKSPNGSTYRLQQQQNPVWTFQLIYEVLKDRGILSPYTYSEYRILQGFFLARQGQDDDFLFDDPTDNSVGPALNPDLTPNTQAALQVVTDGLGNYYSPIQRNFGGQFFEDITDLNGSIAVYANGTLMALTTDYTIGGPGLAIPGFACSGLYLHWVAVGTPPATPVTAQFNFYFRVRFGVDKQDFEQFTYDLWTVGGSEGKNSSQMTLVTARQVFA